MVLDFAEVQMIFVAHSIYSYQEFVGLFLDNIDQAFEEFLFVLGFLIFLFVNLIFGHRRFKLKLVFIFA